LPREHLHWLEHLTEAGPPMTDPHDLIRFLRAQNPMYDQILTELRAGKKEGHWIWFIFPQLRGLGFSPKAEEFGISSSLEAAAYLRHPILGPRLRECAQLVLSVEGRTIRQILGRPDDMKIRSSMTLFRSITPHERVFDDVLQKYFAGEPDMLTLERLSAEAE
jgi:uncharacterized protein (DUF1810 family)